VRRPDRPASNTHEAFGISREASRSSNRTRTRARNSAGTSLRSRTMPARLEGRVLLSRSHGVQLVRRPDRALHRSLLPCLRILIVSQQPGTDRTEALRCANEPHPDIRTSRGRSRPFACPTYGHERTPDDHPKGSLSW
jgi:hypothetical protein